jgi:imidazole glycerol-phosphate synthase subunit HisF
MIPFSVGGGISRLEHAQKLLEAGADKVSVNTTAVTRPELLSEIAEAYGSQCCVLAIDAKRKESGSGWEVLTHGGKTRTGLDAFEWAQKAVALGAGEILLTSWDMDGTRQGFDLELTRTFAKNLPIPVIASGGASGPQSFIDVFKEGHADAALAASIFHDGQWRVDTLKAKIQQEGCPIRL